MKKQIEKEFKVIDECEKCTEKYSETCINCLASKLISARQEIETAQANIRTLAKELEAANTEIERKDKVIEAVIRLYKELTQIGE